ncbi:MAG: MerR family transcriptional regulator [Acidobacteriaceae bacterium]
MPKHAAHHRAPQDTTIPDKLYFRIGEVAKLCGVETYVLRFWETEFPQMRPNKSGTGQRLYRKRDVEYALHVKTLLHDQGYTIAGARQLMAQEASRSRGPQLALIEKEPAANAAEAKLQKLRGELKDLLGILSGAPGRADRKPRAENQRGPNLFE